MGATLYFLLTAKRPGFLYMVEVDDPAMELVDPVLRPFVLRCMAYSAKDRFPTARATALQVARLADVLATQAGQSCRGEGWMRPLRSRRPSHAVAAARWLARRVGPAGRGPEDR